MKKINFLLVAIIALATFSFSSCKKDDASTPTLLGKWKIASEIIKENGVTIESIPGGANDYIDFKSSNMVESMQDGILTTSSYMLNGNQLTIDGDMYTVVFTATNCTITYTYTDNNVTYTDIINLIK